MIRWLAGTRRDHSAGLLGCCSGNVSVELALLAPVLLLVLLGVAEYGRAYTEQLSLSRVARAQLQYAVENLAATSVLDEIDALSKTLPNGDTVTFSTARSCSCLGASMDCYSLCDGASLTDMEVQVTASRGLAPMVFFPGHPGSLDIAAVASMRVR